MKAGIILRTAGCAENADRRVSTLPPAGSVSGENIEPVAGRADAGAPSGVAGTRSDIVYQTPMRMMSW